MRGKWASFGVKCCLTASMHLVQPGGCLYESAVKGFGGVLWLGLDGLGCCVPPNTSSGQTLILTRALFTVERWDCSGPYLSRGMLKTLLPTPLSLDTEGKAHALWNDSDCGLWVSETPDGSREVFVSYAGCYVFEWVSDLRGSAGMVATAALAALTGVALPRMVVTSCCLGLKEKMLLDKRFFMKRGCSGALWTFLVRL